MQAVAKSATCVRSLDETYESRMGGGWDGALGNPPVKVGGKLVEYGYASRSLRADAERACSAISSVGRGINERTVAFNEGWAERSAVSSGKRDCDGRLASSTPTSTSFSSEVFGALFSLPSLSSLEPDSVATRARFGAARLGRSGVGLRSIKWSAGTSSSSSLRFSLTGD